MTSSPARDTLALSSIGVQSLVEWPPLSFLFLAHKRWPLVTVTKPSVILIPRGSIGVVCIGVAQIDHTIGSGKLKKEKNGYFKEAALFTTISQLERVEGRNEGFTRC